MSSRSVKSAKSTDTLSTLKARREKLLTRKAIVGIPRAANWGWSHLPLSAKIMILGVFSGAVCVTTPFWAYLKTDLFGTASFGLWHYCSGNTCTSIHDNLVQGKSVPAWYHMTQGNLCIGVALSIIGLGILTNSIEGRELKMTVTVHRAAACIFGISSLEHFVGLYIFATYLEETDFLVDKERTSYYIDFYGSYYMGVISFLCSIVAGLVVYCDDSISRVPKPDPPASKECSYEEFYANNGYYYDSEDYNDFTAYNGQYMPYGNEYPCEESYAYPNPEAGDNPGFMGDNPGFMGHSYDYPYQRDYRYAGHSELFNQPIMEGVEYQQEDSEFGTDVEFPSAS